MKNNSKNELLNASIQPLLLALNMMFQNSKYEYIKNKYTLNKEFKDKGNMEVVKHLLTCEASFIASKDFKLLKKAVDKDEKRTVEDDDLFPDADDAQALRVNQLMNHYSKVKMKYIEDNKNNLFYKILQSKMEDKNQKNMISYIISSLSTIDLDVGSRNSFW